jgi:hypothetical protein
MAPAHVLDLLDLDPALAIARLQDRLSLPVVDTARHDLGVRAAWRLR